MSENLARCGWAGTDPLSVAYHDTEWGVPSHDARHLFESGTTVIGFRRDDYVARHVSYFIDLFVSKAGAAG